MREGNNERFFLKMAAEVRSYEKIEEENSQRSISNTSQQYEGRYSGFTFALRFHWYYYYHYLVEKIVKYC